ncbi:AAA family ATPase [Variovorax ureilyticus]|uniref:AAA family ATPase n=1 Tax=Variovorax ureilyticus TaxID=1836198 RepID=A0ABU8VP75_9BURK
MMPQFGPIDSTTSVEDAARSYMMAGLHAIRLVFGTKAALERRWQHRETAPPHKFKGFGVGLHHGPSGTCCIDLDDLMMARVYFKSHQIDIDKFLNDPRSVKIDSGRKNRAKLLYRVPDGVDLRYLPVMGADKKRPIIELRAGYGRQDVLPPSRHPDTGLAYGWVGDWQNIPELPSELLMRWKVEQASIKTKRLKDLEASAVNLDPDEKPLYFRSSMQRAEAYAALKAIPATGELKWPDIDDKTIITQWNHDKFTDLGFAFVDATGYGVSQELSLEAFNQFLEWCRQDQDVYDEDGLWTKWLSYQTPGGVKAAILFKLANLNDDGWKPRFLAQWYEDHPEDDPHNNDDDVEADDDDDGEMSDVERLKAAPQLMRTKPRPPTPAVPGFFNVGELASLVAKGGTGKTTFLLQLAIHHVLGREFFGLDIIEGDVVYFSKEDTLEDLLLAVNYQMQALMLSATDRKRVKKGLILISTLHPDLQLKTNALVKTDFKSATPTKLIKNIIEAFEHRSMALFVFDTNRHWISSDSMSESAQIVGLGEISKLINHPAFKGSYAIVLDHTGQSVNQDHQYAAIGSSTKGDLIRGVTTLIPQSEPNANEDLIYTWESARGSLHRRGKAQLKLKRRSNSYIFERHEPEAAIIDPEFGELTPDVQRVLKHLHAQTDHSSTKTAIAEELGITTKTLLNRKVIEDMVSRKLVTDSGKNKGARITLTAEGLLAYEACVRKPN